MILINICEYWVPHCGAWLLRTLQVCFWLYVGLSAVASAGLYLILWSTLYVPSLEIGFPVTLLFVSNRQQSFSYPYDDTYLGLPCLSAPAHMPLCGPSH